MKRIFVLITIMSLYAFSFSLSVSADEKSSDYVFFFDNKRVYPRILSLAGEPEHPREGDLADFDGIYIPLQKPGIYRFTGDRDELGKVFRIMPDGTKKSAVEALGYQGRLKRAPVNPLKNLPDAELKEIMTVAIGSWRKEFEPQLKKLDSKKTCFMIATSGDDWKDKSLPLLPSEVRYLVAGSGSTCALEDLSKLELFTSLGFLRIDLCDEISLKTLSNLKALTYLDLHSQSIKETEKSSSLKALSNLTQLRVLDISHTHGIEEVSFTSSLSSLRRLLIEGTGITDLSPLSGHKSIEYINADMTTLKNLPGGNLPLLRTLSVLSTPLSNAEIERFKKENPQCHVIHRWNEAFVERLSKATRIRVYSHHYDESERTTSEITCLDMQDPAKIREIIAALDINESESGFHCLCSGDPHFDFFEGEAKIATISLHHGRSLRWDGVWPADAMLTSNAAAFLCNWLADSGVKGPLHERNDMLASQRAAMERVIKCSQLIPPVLFEKIRTSKWEQVADLCKEEMPDEMKRAELCLRLLGCDEDSWNTSGGVNASIAMRLKEKLNNDALCNAYLHSMHDPLMISGAARWLFSWEEYKKIDNDKLCEMLPALASNALSHPRKVNRWITFRTLEKVGGKVAIEVLREVLNGKISIRNLQEDEKGEPGGYVIFDDRMGEISEKCSDEAYAALILARLQDRESLPRIKELLVKSSGEEKKVIDEALKLMK